jgi:hypothetical protein
LKNDQVNLRDLARVATIEGRVAICGIKSSEYMEEAPHKIQLAFEHLESHKPIFL